MEMKGLISCYKGYLRFLTHSIDSDGALVRLLLSSDTLSSLGRPPKKGSCTILYSWLRFNQNTRTSAGSAEPVFLARCSSVVGG